MKNSNVEPDGSGTGAPSIQGRRATGRLRGAVLLAAFAAAAVLGLAACGGGGSTSPATTSGNGGSNGSSASYQESLKLAQCMRSHGVPNFPDPQSNGTFDINGNQLNTNSSQFKTAQNDCEKFAPAPPSQAQQAQSFAAALKYAQCMRSHGLPNFPDPKQGSNGNISSSIGSSVGNPNSPQFQKAAQACRSLLGARSQGGGPGSAPQG